MDAFGSLSPSIIIGHGFWQVLYMATSIHTEFMYVKDHKNLSLLL